MEIYKMLDIDLSTRQFQSEDIATEIVEKFMGGRGLGAYLLYRSTEKGMNPLAPENPLIFSSG